MSTILVVLFLLFGDTWQQHCVIGDMRLAEDLSYRIVESYDTAICDNWSVKQWTGEYAPIMVQTDAGFIWTIAPVRDPYAISYVRIVAHGDSYTYQTVRYTRGELFPEAINVRERTYKIGPMPY